MPQQTVTIHRDVLHQAKLTAEQFRRQRAAEGTLVVQLMSSPGAGKTSLLEAMARQQPGDLQPSTMRAAVLVGDIATDRDARRLAPWLPVVQLTTGGACHLEIPLVEQGFAALLATLPTGQPLDYLFIENIGNLVCPASHDLGEHLRVVLLAVTEGDDKPAKYPKAFRTSDVLVLTKTDLLPHVPFSTTDVALDARRIQPNLAVLSTSALTGEGVSAWRQFLAARRRELLDSTGIDSQTTHHASRTYRR